MEQFTNLGSAVLHSNCSSGDASITIDTPVDIPSTGNFSIRIDNELMSVTSISGSGPTYVWSVTRPLSGTSAASHTAGAAINLILTAEALNALVSVQANGTETSNRRVLNFVSGAAVSDNSANSRADIAITGATYGAGASRPAAGTAGRIYVPSDGVIPSVDTGSAWAGLCAPGVLSIPPLVSGFTGLNTTGATFSDIPGGGIAVVVPAASGDSNHILMRSATPPFTVTVGLVMSVLSTGFIRMGLALVDSVSGKLIQFGVAINSGFRFEGTKYNSVTSFNGTAFDVTIASLPPIVFLRVVDNSTTRSYQTSAEGYLWATLFSEASGTFVSPNHVGIDAQSNNSSVPALMACVHWAGA